MESIEVVAISLYWLLLWINKEQQMMWTRVDKDGAG
jgi:hypothetical protein